VPLIEVLLDFPKQTGQLDDGDHDHLLTYPFENLRFEQLRPTHTDLGMPKFALPTFKTPSLFKKSAPPTAKDGVPAAPTAKDGVPAAPSAKDGVPAHLVKYFARVFNPETVKPFWQRGSRDCYGILTRGGQKYYFQAIGGDKGGIRVKVSQTDTTSRVVMWNCEPNSIKKWKEEYLTKDQQLKDDVFWIRDPTDYFATVKLKQNIWPIDKAPVMPVSESQSLSHEHNPYFI